MLLNITLIILVLVATNFLLLLFSCNSTRKESKVNKMPVVLKPQVTIELETEIFAPTGS
jgi:hypothetical protein